MSDFYKSLMQGLRDVAKIENQPQVIKEIDKALLDTLPSIKNLKPEQDRYKEINIRSKTKPATDNLILDEKLIQSDSDEAFKKNVQTELDAGKPRKQALAIAYSIKEKNRMKKGLNEEKLMNKYYIVWNHFDPDDLSFIKDEFDEIEAYYGDDYIIEEIENFKPGLYFISHDDENATILHTGCANEEEFYKTLKEKLDKIDLSQESIELPILGWEIDFDVEDIDHTSDAIIDDIKDMIENSYVDSDSMSSYDLFELSDKDFSPIGDEEDKSDDYEEDDQELEELDLYVKDILDKRDEEDSIYLKIEDFPGADPKEKFHINLIDDDGVERHYTMYFDGIASYSDEHPEFETYPVRFKLSFYNEKLDEAVDNNKIISEIKSAIRDYYSEFDDEDYEDFIGDYLYVEVKDTDDDRMKVEVRAELGYDEFTDLIDEKLDKIIQKYDEDAYFEMEDAGIANAFIRK